MSRCHIFNYDFTKSYDTRQFEYYTPSKSDITHDEKNGLTINTNEYTSYISPGKSGHLDHIKWSSLLSDVYELKTGEFIYEACMAAQQLITPDIVPSIYRSRIRNIHEDYRLCSSGLVIYDDINMLSIMILFTNDWIYGYYECYSRASSNSDNAAFTSVIPLCKRGASSPLCGDGSLDDFIIVGIGINSSEGTIKFYVNKIAMFCIPRIGYRLSDQYQVNEQGGIPYIITPHTLKLGFGHFSFLDHNIPNNYSREYVTEESDFLGYRIYRSASGLAQLLPAEIYKEPYPDYAGNYNYINPLIYFAYSGSNNEYFNFHQGMITRLRYITGYLINSSGSPQIIPMTTSSNPDRSSVVISHNSAPTHDSPFNINVDISSHRIFDSSEDSMRKLFNCVNHHDTTDSSIIESYSLGDLYQSTSTIRNSIPQNLVSTTNPKYNHDIFSSNTHHQTPVPSSTPDNTRPPLHQISNIESSTYSLSDLYRHFHLSKTR